MIGMSVTATTATTATFAFTALEADGTIDLQISPRADFQFCVCPIYKIPRATPFVANGLNQRGTYYARARSRRASGAVDTNWTPTIGFRTADAAAQIIAPAAVMIEPAMIVMPEPILEFADWTAATLPGFPMANLGRDMPVAWRATRANIELYWRIAPTPVDTIALLQTNLPESARVRISAANSLDGTGQLQNLTFDLLDQPFRASANVPGRMGYHGLFRLGQTVQAPWWRISIVGHGAPADTIHAEHLVIGLNRTSKNYAGEKTETAAPQTSVERKRSGIVDRVKGYPMRKVDFDLQMLPEAQYETIYADLWQRENDPVLVVPNSKANGFLHDRILYGDLGGGRSVNPYSPRFNRTFTINSII